MNLARGKQDDIIERTFVVRLTVEEMVRRLYDRL